jgi:hypothetical protein
VFGDVGQRLLRDAVQGQPHCGRHPIERPIDVKSDLQACANEIVDQSADIADARLRIDLHRGTVEQPDGTADVGHRLPAEVFRLFERLDRVIDVSVFLQPAASPRDVQKRDAQRVCDDVVHLAGDAPTFVGRGMFGQGRLRFLLLDHQPLLDVHEKADQPAAGGFYLPQRALTDPRLQTALDKLISKNGRATYLLIYGNGHEWSDAGAERSREIQTAVREATKEGTLTPTAVHIAGVGATSLDLQTLVGREVTLLLASTLALIFLVVALMLRSPLGDS